MAYVAIFSVAQRHYIDLEWDPKPAKPPMRWDNRGPPQPMNRGEVPARAVFESRRAGLNDFVSVHAWLAVSERVRNHIAAIEPDHNQFFAFEVARARGAKPILGPDGGPLTEHYYLLNVTTRFDAVRIDCSPVDLSKTEPAIVSPRPGLLGEVVLDKAMVAGHHVWEGIYHLRGKILFSDSLAEWISDNKMEGLDLVHLDET